MCLHKASSASLATASTIYYRRGVVSAVRDLFIPSALPVRVPVRQRLRSNPPVPDKRLSRHICPLPSSPVSLARVHPARDVAIKQPVDQQRITHVDCKASESAARVANTSHCSFHCCGPIAPTASIAVLKERRLEGIADWHASRTIAAAKP